jgi:hypothetical protein
MNMADEVRKLMEFIGLKLDNNQLNNVIQHCSFESMKASS